MLESQPQKSGIARRGSAVVYGLRGLVDHGRERLRGAGGRISELREHVPGRTVKTSTGGEGAPPPRLPKRIGSRRPRKPKPGRVKKLRIAVIVVGLGALAMVSTIFGMMVSLSRDVPQLENKEQYAAGARTPRCSTPRAARSAPCSPTRQRILVESEDISPYIKQAVVAIEDERFYEHRGVDYPGIGRALFAGADARRLHPGSLDDHPAVRQERARGAGQQNGLPEVPRGRLRLPPRAPVGQGQDPDPVPEHHLLRRGRLRDRGGRAHLLRVPLSRLRRGRRRPLLLGAGARGGGAAGGAHLLALGLLPARQSQRLRRPAKPRAAEDERAGRALRRGVR